MSVVLVVVRLGLAAVFGIAGAAKLADRTGFQRALGGFGLPVGSAKPIAVALPLAELAVAVALILPGTAWWAAGAAVLLLFGFIAVIGRSLARGQTPECKCFGRLSAGQVGRRTIVRNGVFTLAAAGLVVAGPARLAP